MWKFISHIRAYNMRITSITTICYICQDQVYRMLNDTRAVVLLYLYILLPCNIVKLYMYRYVTSFDKNPYVANQPKTHLMKYLVD